MCSLSRTCSTSTYNMVTFKHITSLRSAVLFLLLLPPTLSVLYYDFGNEDGGLVGSSETAVRNENALVVRRSAESLKNYRPKWHPARTSSSVNDKRYLPYHPVVRFRSPKPYFEYPPMKYSRRFEDRLKKDLSAGEILALLSNIMIEGASQGRLKGLRFGISKRSSGYIPNIFTWNRM